MEVISRENQEVLMEKTVGREESNHKYIEVIIESRITVNLEITIP